MSKEKIIDVNITPCPDVRVRVIESDDPKEIKKNKKKFPFELFNTVSVFVQTTKRNISFQICNGYTWNGADIPRMFWRIIGSRTDNDFLVASMVHDYMLEFKKYMLKEILKGEISVREYRRLTSLIFRHIIKQQGTNTIKANIMAWCVDVFQMTCNRKNWKVEV